MEKKAINELTLAEVRELKKGLQEEIKATVSKLFGEFYERTGLSPYATIVSDWMFVEPETGETLTRNHLVECTVNFKEEDLYYGKENDTDKCNSAEGSQTVYVCSHRSLLQP